MQVPYQLTRDPDAPPRYHAASDRPEWLNNHEAGTMWNTLAQNLWDDERFDPQLDWVALAMLCTSYKDFLDAMEIVEAEGRICTAKTGAKYQHPAVGMMNKARESYMAGCKHFGLSPFSREK